MRRGLALLLLVFNFLKEAVVSGWATARMILRNETLQPGFVRMPYGNLDETAASFLAALVTLTPGTTTVDIDTGRRELLLHLLDASRAESTLAAIRRDFLEPVAIVFGGRR